MAAASKSGPGSAMLGEDGLPPLPEPAHPALDEPYGILVTGVGGTGVVTIGALLGMAAHLEGKGCTILDMTGLAQKGGAVYSHVRIAREPGEIHAVRIAAGSAQTAARLRSRGFGQRRCALEARARPQPRDRQQPRNRSPAILPATRIWCSRPARCERSIAEAAGPENTEFVDATRLATGLFGNSIASNLFMLGYAYQRGLVPLSAEAIERAIELNGVAVEFNLGAFRWGRRAAVDPALVEARATPRTAIAAEPPSLRNPRSGDRAPGRVSDRLPGSRLCRALRRPGRARARGRGGRAFPAPRR